MTLETLMSRMLPAIEEEMRAVVSQVDSAEEFELLQMLTYHLGWEGEGAGPNARGKRVRPLLLLLTTMGTGGDWEQALPAAAAVELVHNFSLVHDDIQDESPLRRGRPTVWKKWGIAQAINAGDSLYALAGLAIFRLDGSLPAAQVNRAAEILQTACLRLTQGQYLDMMFEHQDEVSLDWYWRMVEGKTATLLATCTHLGALISGAHPKVQQGCRQFGLNLGLAFQAVDDLLGVWGDPAQTGKSSQSDLLARKKTLPVVYALQHNGAFAQRWRQEALQPKEVSALAALLREEGAYDYVVAQAQKYTLRARQALKQAIAPGEAKQALLELTDRLLKRLI